MLNEFTGIGNLGLTPILQKHRIDDEPRSVVNASIYFDRPVRQDDDSYQDKGGFWLNVAFWGRLADEAMRLLHKGSRVCVMGRLQVHQWTDKDSGKIRSELQLTADYFFIDTVCIESIEYKMKVSTMQEELA